ncbi:FMN-binding negative transcriptional regulator [Phytomonospora sp. NPDC050363]|uniref:FMN-binding negative transcriptional regulator n=1 Tax=Phytomonospora sp. NPDC050363 TaxID=3155642 RepID=UPI0033F30438
MYVPAHFAPGGAEVADLLTNHGAADLVTSTARGMIATLLPFVHDPGAGERGSLLGHVARNNDQWREPAIGDALVIVRGPDFYVSPTWYPSKAEHGRAVPTWNYVTAHVYGRLVVHDDPAWLASLVRRLTEKHEGRRAKPWTVEDAPARFVEGQLRAIVGVEVVIDRVEAKFKLNQNRSRADVDGVVAGLTAEGDESGVRAMREGNGG